MDNFNRGEAREVSQKGKARGKGQEVVWQDRRY